MRNLIPIDEVKDFLFESDWAEHAKNVSEEVWLKFMCKADSSWGMPFKVFGKCEKYGYFIAVPQEDSKHLNLIWTEK